MRPRWLPLGGVLLSLALVSACLGSGEADEESAEEYPSETIRWIVTFDPGGGSDTDFRRLQPHLEDDLGVKLEIEYRTGAGGAIGWAEMVNAEPDGYTIGSVVLPHIILQPRTLDDAGYQTEYFDFIAMNAYAPQILFVDANDPAFESFEEFEQHVQDNPGDVDLAGAAEFNASHVSWGLLQDQGLDTNWVSTGEGSTEAVAGVVGGHFPAGITSAQGAVGSDEIEALAVFAEEEYEYLPGVPTMADFGYEAIQETNWGIGAPAGMSMEKRQVIWEAVEEALDEDEVLQNMENEGQSMIGLGPDETAEYVDDVTTEIEEVLPLLEEATN